MPEDIKNKVKQVFVESISIKQEIIDEESYKVLIEAGDIIPYSIASEGGDASQNFESSFVVLGKVTARIQESHITTGRALLHYIEDLLLESGWLVKY